MSRDLLLLSNSQLHGRPYLAHVRDELAAFLAGIRTLHFAPWALRDHAGYTAKVREAFAPLGIAVTGLHETGDARAALAAADALFVGGGNTFRLLDALQRHDLMELVRSRVERGELRYLGSSAGTNVAAPTIRTTNDMPIVQPRDLGAFGLVPFQINPHYVDADPSSRHMGETRAERLTQYLEENETPVLGLREGAWLRRRDGSLHLGGDTGAVVFRRASPPAEVRPGADLSLLLEA